MHMILNPRASGMGSLRQVRREIEREMRERYIPVITSSTRRVGLMSS